MLDQLTRSTVPLVVLGRPFEADGVSYIDVDNINAAKKATQHLISLGYQRIGMIIGAKTSTVSQDRREGFIKAFVDAGKVPDLSLIAEGDFSENSGYLAMQRLLPLQPEAVFAQSDIMAVGAIKAVEEMGLKVPGDVALVGFDDIPVTSLTNIKLTTVRQPITRFGIKAVELLIDLIEKGTEPARRLILDTELIIRDSCGAKMLSVQRGGD
jgi:DNA-binding LacI/PurR family transcriptional regulator